MPMGKFREVHKKKPTTFRKGKVRLRTLSVKQLTEIAEKEKKGKRFDAATKEIARKHKLGMFYRAPEPVEVEENA